MKDKPLILKFNDNEQEFLYEDKVFVIEDKKLIENLKKPAFKNSESKLVIASENNTHISDVIQVKINISETGYFLVSFLKDSLSEETRKSLLDEIGKLKSDSAITNETQQKKAEQVVAILSKYQPIYATFVNDGEHKIDTSKFEIEGLCFPILVLKQPEKKFMFSFKIKQKENTQKSQEDEPRKTYSPFPLFAMDYVFVLLFSLLCSFGIITSIFEMKNGQNIWIFLLILAIAFAFVLSLSVQSTCYKKGKLINPYLRFYLIIFIILGVAGGIAGGFLVSKFFFKTEIENFNYGNLVGASILISAPVCLAAIPLSLLVNLVVKKKYEKKK